MAEPALLPTPPLPEPASSRPALATQVFVLHLVFVWACQAASITWSTRVAAWLPFTQAETWGVSLLLALGAVTASRWRLLRWGLAAGVAAVLLHALLDTLYFRIFAQHFHLSALDGVDVTSSAIFLEALRTELSPSFVVLALGWLTACGALAWWFFPARSLRPPSRMAWSVGAGVLLLQSLTTYGLEAPPEVTVASAHPLVALVRMAVQPAEPSATVDNGIDIETPRFPAPSVVTEAQRAVLHSLGGVAQGRNLVLVIMESVGARQVLAEDGLPNPEVTPNLARWAREGVVFTRLYNSYPATTRSHVPLMTGGYTFTVGVKRHVLHRRYLGPTLVSRVHDAGYQTVLLSAPDLTFENLGFFYRALPWSHWVSADSLDKDARAPHDLNAWGVDDGFMVDQARAWLPQRAAAPFFLAFMTNVTHFPYTVPERVTPKELPARDGGEHKPRYLAALHYSDATLGDLERALQEAGVLRDTVVAVVGDHGESFSEHHANNLAHKSHVYDENIRNFLVVHVPGKRLQLAPLTQPASLGDVTPTLCALLGLPTEGFRGVSLWEPTPSRVFYFQKTEPPAKLGLLDGKWKFSTVVAGAPLPELYDLDADPWEQVNLADQHPDMVQEMSRRGLQWWVRANVEYESRQTRADGP